jgi:precorrin 3B synthase CobZ
MATPEPQYDLVVIGMGAAGLSAAVSYVDTAHGEPRVAVLERSTRDERGGSTRYTSSWFRITEDRELDPNFVPMMESLSGGLADLDYCRTLAREVKGSLQFLDDHGVEVTHFKQPLPNRNTGGGLGMPVGGGIAIVEGLTGVLERTAGVELIHETEAVRLDVSDDGRVSGVAVRDRDGVERTIGAKAVVICSGGFEGNPEMLAEHLGERARELPVIAPGPKNNRGEGIRMAVEIGADTAGQFDMFHAEPVDPRTSKPDPVIYPYPYGIVVNRHAKRFFDEGSNSFDSTFEPLGYEIWRNQEQTAFFLGDEKAWSVNAFEDLIFTDEPPLMADTIGGLAGQLGLDPAALEATVSTFNSAIGPGEHDPYTFDGKSTVGLIPPKSNWAAPLDSPPYFAYPLTCAITFTFGGIRTDSSACVLTATGTRIPGLYAAGEVTGLYYKEYPAGTSVIRAVTFGRIAGAHAANQS